MARRRKARPLASRRAVTAPRRRPLRPPATASTPYPILSSLLELLKRTGPLTRRELAARLGITYEAVRQQVGELLRTGWLVREPEGARGSAQRGPLSRRYALSAAAEHLFPKHYDELSSEIVQRVAENFGGKGVVQVLARMTDARVGRWAPRLEGLGLKERMRALCSLYEDKDAYMELEWRAGAPALIEHNCPFLNVARSHPAICSVSVNTLERLLGYQVVREQRFQAGHGRCLFRVRVDRPRGEDQGFTLEP